MRIRVACFTAWCMAGALQGQDARSRADIDEAFQLANVRGTLGSIQSQISEIATTAAAQLTPEKREQFEAALQDSGLKLLTKEAFYRQLRTYFARHYDAGKMATFVALERTPGYRTMHRLEAAAQTPAEEAARRRFEATLKSDPPLAQRVAILQRLDAARSTTDREAKIAAVMLNQSAQNIKTVLSTKILFRNLYVYRDTEDADLEDYIAAAQQSAVAWFNRTLDSAILAAAAEDAAPPAEPAKTGGTPAAH